jgi:hypothetical protein
LEDDNFVFETPHSNYMCSDAHLNGELSANREKVGLWETFKIEELPNDYSAIKTSTGAYLGMNPVNNKIYATSETIGEPEKFRLEEVK